MFSDKDLRELKEWAKYAPGILRLIARLEASEKVCRKAWDYSDKHTNGLCDLICDDLIAWSQEAEKEI